MSFSFNFNEDGDAQPEVHEAALEAEPRPGICFFFCYTTTVVWSRAGIYTTVLWFIAEYRRPIYNGISTAKWNFSWSILPVCSSKTGILEILFKNRTALHAFDRERLPIPK